MLNSTWYRNAQFSRLVPAMVAVAVLACSAAQAVACDDEKVDVRRIVRVGDSDADSEVLVQVARLSEQIEALQVELDGLRAVLAGIGGGEHGSVVRAPRAAHVFVMPPMPPMPPMPAMPTIDWPDGFDNPEARAEWKEEMREWKEDFAGEWRELAQEWKDNQRELNNEWRERGREMRGRAQEMADLARDRAQASRSHVRELVERVVRERTRGRQRSSTKSTQQSQVVYLAEGEHAEQLYDLLAPSDVRVIVSRAGEHVAVRGTQNEHEVLNAGLQLLGWIDRDETFERMGQGKRVDRKYKVGKKRSRRLFDMLAPNDVRVVVSHAGDKAVSVSGTKREQEALADFLELLRW